MRDLGLAADIPGEGGKAVNVVLESHNIMSGTEFLVFLTETRGKGAARVGRTPRATAMNRLENMAVWVKVSFVEIHLVFKQFHTPTSSRDI